MSDFWNFLCFITENKQSHCCNLTSTTIFSITESEDEESNYEGFSDVQSDVDIPNWTVVARNPKKVTISLKMTMKYGLTNFDM